MNTGGVDQGIDCPSIFMFAKKVCIECNEERHGFKNIYLCNPCYDKWQGEKSDVPAFIEKVTLKHLQATKGHIKDIKSRKLAEDGRSVVREQARRTYFTGG